MPRIFGSIVLVTAQVVQAKTIKEADLLKMQGTINALWVFWTALSDCFRSDGEELIRFLDFLLFSLILGGFIGHWLIRVRLAR